MGDHLRDKVRSHANDGNQRDCLKNPDDLECRAESSVVWCGHGGEDDITRSTLIGSGSLRGPITGKNGNDRELLSSSDKRNQGAL